MGRLVFLVQKDVFEVFERAVCPLSVPESGGVRRAKGIASGLGQHASVVSSTSVSP